MPTPNFDDDDELYLGVSALDADHQILCECLGALLDAHAACAEVGDLDVLAQRLVDFAKDHFEREQEWMASTHYDKSLAHQKEHQRLLGDLTVILEHVKESGEYALGEEVRGFLEGWLSGHIKGADKELADYLLTLEDSQGLAI